MVFFPRCRQEGIRASIGAVLACIGFAGPTFAQAPQTTSNKTVTDIPHVEKAAPFDALKLKGSIQKELAQARARMEPDAAKLPADITPQERESARKVRTMLVHVFMAQLEMLDQIAQHERTRATAEKAQREWPGFPQPPPYSNLLADDVREQVATRRAAVEVLQSSRDAMRFESKRFGDRARRAEEEVRRTAEALEQTSAGTDRQTAAPSWRLEAARDRSQLANAFVATANIGSREVDTRLAVAQAELRLAERQLAALNGNFRISRADLEGAESRLNAVRAQWDRDLQLALLEAAKWAQRREQAGTELESARAGLPLDRDSPVHAYAVQLAEATFRATDAWSSSLAQEVRILTGLITLYHERILEAWRWRYAALSQPDPDARQYARKQLDELVDYLKDWDSRSRSQQHEVRSAIQEQDQRILSGTDPAILRYEREALVALRQLDLAFERQQAVFTRRMGRLEYWREDFAEALKGRPLTEVAGDLYARTASLAQGIWNYELLSIEDKVEVAGQTLTTSRGVTVGKSIGALVLFLIALRLMTLASVRMERLMIRRFDVNEEKAKMMRRWVNAFGVTVLLMITLNIARIPLTVFAFAGGALAIGVGFGMQTLIKNLISGVIVLLERHVRVGDVIEVDGVTGKVTAVDVRSSTIRGADGVESMIPNASLLEGKVTNWTLTNADLRRVVKVGVAYGAPVHTVAQILEECALRHGMILKEPAPSVIFEDFGESALVFSLYFWINLSPNTNPLQIMSDLRFMIDKNLREAGIMLALPRRDIQIDPTRPIRVEFASADEIPFAAGLQRFRSGSA